MDDVVALARRVPAKGATKTQRTLSATAFILTPFNKLLNDKFITEGELEDTIFHFMNEVGQVIAEIDADKDWHEWGVKINFKKSEEEYARIQFVMVKVPKEESDIHLSAMLFYNESVTWMDQFVWDMKVAGNATSVSISD